MERDGEIITLLALGLTRQQAAERVNTSERTVYRRLRDPHFQERLTQTRLAFQGLPPHLVRLYRILEDLRGGLRFLDGLDSEDMELTAEEARKHLSNAIRWVEEWTWLREQDLAPVELHGDTCACILGEAA